MLFVAGALFVSYILAFDRGYFLIWFGEVGEVAAEEEQNIAYSIENSEPLQDSELGIEQEIGQQLVFEPEVNNTDEVVSLSESLSAEPVLSLSQALKSDPTIGQWTQAQFETPDPVVNDGKQFFSVQQLFAESNGAADTIQQWVLDLEYTYEWANNGKFLVANRIGIQNEVEYILKDQWNTHYVYLGNYVPTVFDQLVEWAAVVAIEEKISINRSWFFGDSLWLFSIAEYEARQKIIALVRFESQEDTWLFQIDRDRFENWGSEMLQESFAQYYPL